MSEAVRIALARRRRRWRTSLSRDEARAAMGAVMDGEATPSQLGALLLALRVRGETVDELAGFAQAMRERVVPVQCAGRSVDTCGTGGDGAQTFNISTAAALVVAAAGVPVAKHGNRAVTSQSGSADVLEALGVPIDHGPEEAAQALAAHCFAFLFAPGYHPAMRHAGPVRRELGVPTAFNLLGPADQPGRRAAAGDGRGRPIARRPASRACCTRWAWSAPSSSTARASTSCRSTARAWCTTCPWPASGGGGSTRPTSACARRRARSCVAEARPTTPQIIEDVLGGRDRGPRRDVALLNAAAPLLVLPAVPAACARASSRRRRRSTTGMPAAC
jgi:anthranilate phosphoribosyltransferase